MKKKLLISSLFFSALASAQSLTQANEPAIGASATMYVCDSSFSNFSATAGSGVTWDFSAITGYESAVAKVVTVSAPANADFSPATKVTSITDFIATYWTSTSTERTSQGFVYSDPDVGDVQVKFSTDAELLVNYPFALSNSFTDNYSGTLYNGSITPTGAIPCTGSNAASIDGQGTLLLPSANSFADVIRYKIEESSEATITVFGITVDATVLRTQYDYYSSTNSMPLFSHVKIDILQNGSLLNTSTLVLSSVQPATLLSISENKKVSFEAFPNPTKGILTLNGEFGVDASAVIIDQAGRTVATVDHLQNGTNIDLSAVQKGLYFAVVNSNGVKSTKTICVE